ncbi:hypothetical protein GCM10009682_37340 [Luedemannella flava]|uniref:Uncharacterized protein n=1 Tax=Luedemannella flava TaxID=349316 RepID=A0ABN2M8S6_9ACTN
MSLIRQLSLFGVEAHRPEPADLVGLLAGGGRVVRMGGTARVVITVDDPWRAAVLVRECARRDLAATVVSTLAPVNHAELSVVAVAESADDGTPPDPHDPPNKQRRPAPPPSDDPETGDTEPPVERFEVRTAYSTMLVPLARTWLAADGSKSPPRRLHLDGRALRLWVTAGGRLENPGVYALAVGPDDDGTWPVVGRALTGAGLGGVLIKGRPGGPAYRISGRRRVARLAEMIGDPPRPSPEGLWPS